MNNNGTRQTDSQWQIAAIVTWVMQAQNSDTVVASNVMARMLQHGPHSRVTNFSTVTTMNPPEPRQYDHLSNICKVTSGPCRTVSSASSGKIMVTSDKVMATEIDNHTDTHCFGQNFMPFSWTGKVCTVSPFLSTYEAFADVKICSVAAAVALDTGETVVLIFGQGLWFGEKMDKSLINPNQCRAYGVGVCDDPTDPHRHLGFYHEDQYLPLYMSGKTSGFESCCPTSQELDESKRFTCWIPTSGTLAT